jgi:hypothetical protein
MLSETSVATSQFSLKKSNKLLLQMKKEVSPRILEKGVSPRILEKGVSPQNLKMRGFFHDFCKKGFLPKRIESEALV